MHVTTLLHFVLLTSMVTSAAHVMMVTATGQHTALLASSVLLHTQPLLQILLLSVRPQFLSRHA